MEFKKLFPIYIVSANISDNKEEFSFNYYRSTGLKVNFNINYDQKEQKVKSLYKYTNNNLEIEINNNKNDKITIDKISTELVTMLKDIKENVARK